MENRLLIVTRGCPGSGKSTWISTHNLENYTLCPDTVRLMLSGPEKQSDGSYRIARNPDLENKTWKFIMSCLEYRLQNGHFTILDATCNHLRDLKKYKELCDKYNCELIVADFTDIPLSQILLQNKNRDPLRFVPEEAITKMYNNFESQRSQVPEDITIINYKNLDLEGILK